MQDPNEDTEWNDVLRAKGIIPEKPKEKEVTEDDVVNMLEATIKEKTQGTGHTYVYSSRVSSFHSQEIC